MFCAMVLARPRFKVRAFEAFQAITLRILNVEEVKSKGHLLFLFPSRVATLDLSGIEKKFGNTLTSEYLANHI